MDDVPLCPEWWPILVWNLHYHPVPWNPGGPVNYPPWMDTIFQQLAMYTMTYRLQDQKAAVEMRGQIEEQLIGSIKQMGRADAQSAR